MRTRAFLAAMIGVLASCSDKPGVDGGSLGGGGAGGSTNGGEQDGSGGAGNGNGNGNGGSSASGGAGNGGSSGDGGSGGDNLPDTPERFLPAIRSGNRLKARVLGPSGADPIFIEWWDSELSVRCEFAYATDGAYRCLPRPPRNAPMGYTSPTCDDDPIVVNFRPDCAEAKYLNLSADIEPACPHRGSAMEAWALESIEPPDNYYDGSPAFCDGPRMSPAAGAFSRVTAPVDPSEFVEGTVRTIADGDRLGIVLLETEDGARLVLDPHDPRYGRCGQGLRFDEGICAPQRVAHSPYDLFEDSNCTSRIVARRTPDECDGPIEAVQILPPDHNSPELASFGTIGEQLGNTVHRLVDGTCTAIPTSEAITGSIESLHRIDPIELLPLEIVTRGSGPLRTLYLAREDGVFLRPGVIRRTGSSTTNYFQGEDGTRCIAAALPDGSYKCRPVGGAAISRIPIYADSGCSQRVVELLPNAPAPVENPTVLYARDLDACAGYAQTLIDVWEVGAPYEGPSYIGDANDCQELAPIEGYYVGDSLVAGLPDLELSTL